MFERKQNTCPAPKREPGRVGWILLWLLGVPIPLLLLLYTMRGCT